MIKGVIIDTTYDTVTLSWIKPEYLPQLYQRDISCTPACGNKVYFAQTVTFNSLVTRDHIKNLRPGSRCDTTFFAVYNPASLDPGLVNTVYTKEKGEKHVYIYICSIGGSRLLLLTNS